jgi:heme exporter protein D
MTDDMSPLVSFFHMGGYWPYIWPAYGVVAFLLIGLLVLTLIGLKRSKQELEALEALAPRRRRRTAAPETGGSDDAQP